MGCLASGVLANTPSRLADKAEKAAEAVVKDKGAAA